MKQAWGAGSLSRVLFALVAFLYLFAFPYHPGLRSPNELCRLWQTRALVDHHELHLNQALRDYGWVGDLSVKDGRYYPSKAPLLSFAAVPLYGALKAWSGHRRLPVQELPLVYLSRLFFTVLPTLALLVLLRRFLRAYVEPKIADAVVATYALGSLAFSYSLLFMSHQPTAVLLFFAFYALWRLFRGDWKETWGAIGAGALAGAAVATEYTGALGVAALGVYGLWEVKRGPGSPREKLGRLARVGGLATAGALPFILALMAYHQAAFGHPLHSGYKYLADAAYQPWHLGGFLGIRFPDPRAFGLSFFSPLRGLFTLSPFLLLAFPGLLILRRPWLRPGAPVDSTADAKPERGGNQGLFAFTVSLVAGYTYFTSSFAYDSWGWTTGPRHLTPLVPFLLLPVALALSVVRAAGGGLGRLLLGVGAGLCVSSVVATGLLSFVNYIPDDVSNALFALAVPLMRDGYFSPSVLSVLGLPNTIAGMALVFALLAAAGLVIACLGMGAGPLVGRTALGGVWLPAGLVLVLHLALMQRSFARSPQDDAALALLRQVWLAPPQGGEPPPAAPR